MQKKLILGPSFFNRPTLVVARELIGKYLVRRIHGKITPYLITETEAYDGPKDMACHARHGKTGRNFPMFSEAGTIYVYFTYGMHWMLNLVCGEKEYPAAVLIRGIQYQGVALILDGPAKLTKALQIDNKLNTLMLGKKSGLWVEDRRVVISPRQIQRTPRIGVEYAGAWAKKKWRFVLTTENKKTQN